MTPLRVLLCVFAAAVVPSALAAITIDAGSYAGKPGDVVVVRIHADGSGAIEATPPAALVYLGASTPNAATGEAAATFLVGQDAAAGDYAVVLTQAERDGGAARATAHIRVQPSAGASVTVTGPDTITATSSAIFTADVVNTGNVADTFRFTVNSNDAVTLSTASAELAPGQSTKLQLTISPLGFGERLGTLNVRSAVDPTYERSVILQYTALALGSSNPNAPFLAYALPLGATYGSQGLTYHAGASLSGDLSSITNTNSAFSVNPTSTSAFLGFYGDSWGTTYSYGSSFGHHLVVRYRGWNAQGTVTPEGRVTTGIAYAQGGWGVRYDHTWGPRASDRLLANHTFSVGPATTLTLAAGAAGEVRVDNTYHASPAGRIGATWSGDSAIVSVAADVAPYLELPWSALVTAYSRETRPWGVSASAHADPTSFDANIQFTEVPHPDIEAMQSLSYTYPDSIGGLFSVAYTSPSNGPDVFGVGRLTLANGTLDGEGLLTANITHLPWLASASLQFTPNVTVAFGETYLAPNYSVSGSLALPLSGSLDATLGLRGSYIVSGANLGAGLGFDTGTGAYSVSGSLAVPFFPGVDVQGQLGYGSATGVSWQVGVTAALQGAFAVPDAVVQAFGGVNTGTVTGIVTTSSPKGTAPAEGITVSALGANRAATTDAQGRYKLVLPPGSYTLAFPGLGAQLVPPDRPRVTVRRQATVRKDLQLRVSYAVTGQVFIDEAGKGTPGSSSVGLAGASVNLERDGKVEATGQSGPNGAFSFRDLTPGRYRVELVAASLPTGYTSTTPPQSVDVNDTNVPFVSLGAQPPRATVKTTLGTGSIALSATVDPGHAPPRALVTVRVRAPAASSVVVTTSDGSETSLAPGKNGTFAGKVEIPGSATAVELMQVTASTASSSSSQTAMVFVNNAPLATLTLDPGSPEAGAQVHVRAQVLTRAHSVTLNLNGTKTRLIASRDQVYTGTLIAPRTPGSYEAILLVDGMRRTQRTMNVLAPTNSQ